MAGVFIKTTDGLLPAAALVGPQGETGPQGPQGDDKVFLLEYGETIAHAA
jgi:hypothetical protein